MADTAYVKRGEEVVLMDTATHRDDATLPAPPPPGYLPTYSTHLQVVDLATGVAEPANTLVIIA